VENPKRIAMRNVATLTVYGFVLTLLLSACAKWEKAQPTSIEGVMRTAGTTNGLAGLKVNLVLDNGTGLAGNLEDNFGVEASTVTDENGHYRIDHRCYRSNSYYVEFEAAPEHWGPISRKRVNVGEHNAQDVNQIPFAWLKLHIKNVNPFDPEDYFGLVFLTPANPDILGYTGRGIDIIKNIRIGGNIQTIMKYGVGRNGVWTDLGQDTLFVATGDTTFHEIFY
jgi:hypothetical protein